MPTCRASHIRSSLVSPCRSNNHRRTQNLLGGSIRKVRSTRYASTATALAPQAKLSDQESFLRRKTRTTLHRTEQFLPRVLPVGKKSQSAASLSFWQKLLDGAYDDLNHPPADAAARVVVYGCDQYSGARDLVTALLEEPFAPEARKTKIQQRWNGVDEDASLSISYGFTQLEDASRLRIPCAWLRQYDVPVEIQELSIPSSTGSRPHSSSLSLFSADVPIIVCNPITYPLSALLSDPTLPLNHGNAILVLTSSPTSSEEFSEYTSKQFPPSLTVLFADPTRAVRATQTISSNPGSAAAVQQYQDGFTGSRLSDLTLAITKKLAVPSGNVMDIHTFTARELTKCALIAANLALKEARREVDEVTVKTIELQDAVAELDARLRPEILGAEAASEVRSAMDIAKRQVQPVMSRLTWWRLVWRVDDVGETVGAAVDQAWCRQLENKLNFHSGRLASSQQALSLSTKTLLSSFTPSSAFHSLILENRLAQIQSSPSYRIHPNALALPIHSRRMQMIYPTNMLHTAAQRVALGMGGSVLSGIGIAWAGWAEQIGILGGALGTGMHTETAVGAGMLVTAIGVRWMVGRWETAKKRWWRDWDRVGQGLERDLQLSLREVLTKQVAIVPTAACEGLRDLANKRKEEIDALTEELNQLEDDVSSHGS
ncbi:hypothetical protein PHLCEN_2v8407 [Hermanssonia centrifuga]|uniref:Mmc1 C-terminal domain-containing protein n=1 Tax=Hermanssonia centrifuga TaxID=98765 RepID=A0A2R6NTP9_9APHY|nr:hypothetical protein PHLCEN_2v8407 [Hermanssonia centrifuga]